MSIGDDEATIAGQTRVLQIIVGALTAGLLSFLGIAVFLRSQPSPRPPPPPPSPLLTSVAFVFATAGLAASVLIPGLITAGARRRVAKGTGVPPDSTGDTRDFLAIYQTQLITGAALNEAPGFFALIVYFLDGTPLALGLALALIVTLVARFPTRPRIEQWIERQRERIAQERQFGG